ncbi:lysophospholipid acyltransferase family protein [Maribacter sp. PR1]|uniref:Lysophospholipid acyltransferase family protein n=1 Tax=Maribacter cobaltidurans TaxID=1178778 RepID=A0ABU7IXM7_9FLAO|nr:MULTISPECIES: lysophospholipid acyltransferase family protein [Maribacter]MDC6390345.1 lysophospholipid acyltransferase family protein [Maribacter sp. PR1]MEE1977735.1 lysophospholipid acyltransferase family protein [Maribacter cobaltidurans]
MKNFMYNLVKNYVKTGLYSYHKQIEVIGLDNVPKDKPVLFLPNHQSALLDVLLIAVDCNRKPYFLTRSDVFGKPLLNKVFNFFQMIPVYRIRDGRSSLSKNEEVFNTCSEILGENKSLVMFPEANHNLKRRVRPLSKGFTRIVLRTIRQNSNLDLQIVPVGLNYKDATSFPDSVTIYYGAPISVNELYDASDSKGSQKRMKRKVSNALKRLTTHIESEADYGNVLQSLEAEKVSFLRPNTVNECINKLNIKKITPIENVPSKSSSFSFFKILIGILNFPIWISWNFFVKPKIWEQEFIGTLRFATALVGFTVYYLILFIAVSLIWSFTMALFVIIAIFLLNRILVKLT